MTGKELRDAINEMKKRNIRVREVEVSAADFKILKNDLYAVVTQENDLKQDELMLHGVKIIGRLCSCGAHPEDWQ